MIIKDTLVPQKCIHKIKQNKETHEAYVIACLLTRENFDEDGKLIEDCKIRNKNQEGDEFIDRKYLSIDYNNINVLNVRAVQELSEIVKRQQEQINSLLTSKV